MNSRSKLAHLQSEEWLQHKLERAQKLDGRVQQLQLSRARLEQEEAALQRQLKGGLQRHTARPAAPVPTRPASMPAQGTRPMPPCWRSCSTKWTC